MESEAQTLTQQHGAAQRSFTSIDAGSFSPRGLPRSEQAGADLEHGLDRILQKLGSELLSQLESKITSRLPPQGHSQHVNVWPVPFTACRGLAWLPFPLSSKPPSLQELHPLLRGKRGLSSPRTLLPSSCSPMGAGCRWWCFAGSCWRAPSLHTTCTPPGSWECSFSACMGKRSTHPSQQLVSTPCRTIPELTAGEYLKGRTKSINPRSN